MASIQGRANNTGEYHKKPITMVAMAATRTGSSLIPTISIEALSRGTRMGAILICGEGKLKEKSGAAASDTHALATFEIVRHLIPDNLESGKRMRIGRRCSTF